MTAQQLTRRISQVLLVATLPTSADVYSVDDGSGESSLGMSINSDIVWLNQFTSVSGMEKITGLQIAFGANSSSDAPADGSPVLAAIWSDPNNDGNPADAQVLNSVAGVVANSHTDTFVSFPFSTPTTIPVGDNFFVGFQHIETGGLGNYAVARDTSSDAGVSWIFANTSGTPLDLNNLGTAELGGTFTSLGFAGNALIRAVASPVSAIPEPSSALPLLLCIATTMLARRRR